MRKIFQIDTLCANFFFFFENCAVYGIMWNNTVVPDRPQVTVWRMRIAFWITGYTYTLRICNTYCFSTVTMVARTPLNDTLYVHCLSCLCVVVCCPHTDQILSKLPTQHGRLNRSSMFETFRRHGIPYNDAISRVYRSDRETKRMSAGRNTSGL